MFWVVFRLTQSLIQHPHWSICRSAVNTLASLSLFSLCGDWRLAFLSESGWLTDWLSDFQLSLCYAVLAESLLHFSFPHIGLFDVVCLLFIFWHLPPSFSQQHCVSRRRCSSACEYLCVTPLSLSSLCLLVYPLIRPSGASRTMEMRSVPKTAWVLLPLCTNPSSCSLTASPLTGWSIHRWLMDTNTRWHSQKSCYKNNENYTDSCMVLKMFLQTGLVEYFQKLLMWTW